MQSTSQFLLALGGILLLGLATLTLGKKTILPRVTLLLIFGAIIGNEVLDIIPVVFSMQLEIVSNMALLMVAFLLGGKLRLGSLKKSARKLLLISISAAITTAILVSSSLMLIGVSTQIAILLGCIASATAPAAILDVVIESGYKGPFSDLLLSIVAIDDAWALMLFGFGMAIVSSLNGMNADTPPLFMIAKDIGGAIILGAVIGLPAAYLTGRIKKGEPILTEALGIVFVCGGLAIWLEVSLLIASMVMGAVISNLAKHHQYPFHAIEGIEWPFMVIFFVLAGASLDFSALRDLGNVGVVYILSRAAGKVIGARVGGQLSNADHTTKNWMGLALLPQAGVAIGMALVAANTYPEYRQVLLSVVISSTVFFEIIGPILSRMALKRAYQA